MAYQTLKRSLVALMVILLSVCATQVKAQYDFTMQGMTLVPQRMYINPAYIPDSKWHIGIPALSSNHITLGYNGHTFSQLIRRDANDSLYVDLGNALDKMGKTNYLTMNLKVDLLSFSFTVGPQKNNFIYSNISLRQSSRVAIPKALIDGIWRGNAAYLGETIDLKKMNADMTAYTEWTVGYARKLFDDQLRVGIAVKYLNGITNVSTDNRGLSLYTDPNNYNITAKADVTLNSAGILGDFGNIGSDISYKSFLTGNHGFAFNIGAHWKSNDKWEVAVSANDLGMIFWKDNTHNKTIGSSNFTYQGLDLATYLTQPDSADAFEEFLDTLEAAFPLTETEDNYNTSLSSQIYVSGAYNFTEKDRLGLDFFGEIYKTHFEPAIALNYTRKFGTIFHLSTSYSYNNRSFANLGLGFALTLGPVQWYLAMDNILAPMIPQHTKAAHFHSGLNFVVDYKDKKIKDRDGDGIMDKVDECPDDFGLEQFAGCPDRDLDSIPDKVDNCPDEFGPKENNGCPWGDKDGDGLTDNVDECPEVPGPEENKGCPWGDIDGDGVTDNIDECDTIPGPEENSGCPWGDRDGDGVLDNVDKCPDEAGPAENNGCPWGDRDGDGVLDNEDRCPDVPGPADNNGCPYQDSDGDGVIDLEDDCPRTPGPAENKGCPVIEEEEQEVLNTAFENLEFETGSDVIAASSYESLDELAALLIKKPEYRLRISGHTDNVGSESSNMTLSEKRSKSVAKYLNNKGVDTSNFIVEWFGESKPIYPNDTKEGRQKNRRVEMEVVFE
ncbi:MAG: OmpA family protein [Flavobacteriales bacterium]|nr:OmpA family protein [Flavobacteriales bacterium]MCB9203390.1 OmpA family protein [Flavobacteriales bacterium]